LEGWTVLHPTNQNGVGPAENHAVVLQRELYGTKVLLLSSLGRAGQRAVLDRHPALRADVLVTSLSNTSEPVADFFIEAVKPKLIILASGDYPAKARPKAACRERLERWRVPIIYTTDTGAAMLTFRPNGWEVRTMNGPRLSFDASNRRR
jgi:competence protein ComEC